MGTKANVLIGTAEITLGVGVLARVVGYTTDGVTMSVKSDYFHAKSEENVGTLKRYLTNQEVEVALNIAEGALVDLADAIPGSSLTGAVLTLGGATLQEKRLTLRGITPGGLDRVIILTLVNPIGEVSMPYKKGEVSIVPVVFSALVADSGEFGEVTDAQAAAPTLLVGASTKSNAAGTIIEAKFSKKMGVPTGKHLEFWFTEESTGVRAFSLAAINGGNDATIDLTVSGVAIVAGKLLALYYALGSEKSDDIGILRSFSAQTVVPRA
jgi:hypothetical protein